MHIPTLETFADSLFRATHRFSNGGVESVRGQSLLRVDFYVSSRITVPDVDGSVYLDPRTYEIRRSTVRLSRVPRDLPNIDSAEVTTTFDEGFPSVPVISSIRSRNQWRPRCSWRRSTSPSQPRNRHDAKYGGTPPFDLSSFNVADLAGVEYYPDGASLPAAFAHTSLRCGALLLWTRDR